MLQYICCILPMAIQQMQLLVFLIRTIEGIVWYNFQVLHLNFSRLIMTLSTKLYILFICLTYYGETLNLI